jgi:hypothetical protein
MLSLSFFRLLSSATPYLFSWIVSCPYQVRISFIVGMQTEKTDDLIIMSSKVSLIGTTYTSPKSSEATTWP